MATSCLTCAPPGSRYKSRPVDVNTNTRFLHKNLGTQRPYSRGLQTPQAAGYSRTARCLFTSRLGGDPPASLMSMATSSPDAFVGKVLLCSEFKKISERDHLLDEMINRAERAVLSDGGCSSCATYLELRIPDRHAALLRALHMALTALPAVMILTLIIDKLHTASLQAEDRSLPVVWMRSRGALFAEPRKGWAHLQCSFSCVLSSSKGNVLAHPKLPHVAVRLSQLLSLCSPMSPRLTGRAHWRVGGARGQSCLCRQCSAGGPLTNPHARTLFAQLISMCSSSSHAVMLSPQPSGQLVVRCPHALATWCAMSHTFHTQ
jgi:hypothetical protein